MHWETSFETFLEDVLHFGYLRTGRLRGNFFTNTTKTIQHLSLTSYGMRVLPRDPQRPR